MSDTKNKYFTLENVIKIGILLVSISVAFAFVQADVERNTEWNERQDSDINALQKMQRDLYLRKDVAAEQFKAIRSQLNRIENKLDE